MSRFGLHDGREAESRAPSIPRVDPHLETSTEAAQRHGLRISEIDRARSAGILHPVASQARGPRFDPADVDRALHPTTEITAADRRDLRVVLGASAATAVALIVWAVTR
jgi:hypothetical protein